MVWVQNCVSILLNKNFKKNEMESKKSENPTHSFRDEPCVSAHTRIAN